MHLIVYGRQVRLGRQDKDVGWMHMGMRMGVVALLLLAAGGLPGQSSQAAHHVVDTMLLHVGNTGEHSNLYMYMSEERSDRTSGHLWTERVAETSVGKVRLLVAEDGQTLNPGRAAAERARLADIAAHPEAFQRREQAVKGDEQHAEQMLVLLQKGFLFEEPRVEGGDLQIAFRPDPAYQPLSLEERVMHGMSGSILVDERTMELHRIEARLPADVSLGYGLLGTIHAGSSFSTTHEPEPGNEWKTSALDTEIDGKVLFFKSIGKRESVVHRDFKLLQSDISVPQAVKMLESSS
jgi:hypothetical protein